jgi:hypothetical protein
MALERNKKTEPVEQVIVSSTDIQWIKDTLSQMSTKMQEVDASLVKLNQTVIGDKMYGQTGLVEKVQQHENYIEKDKEFKSKIIGGGIVVAFLWGIILKLLKI